MDRTADAEATEGAIPPINEALIPQCGEHQLWSTLAGRDGVLDAQAQPRRRSACAKLSKPVPGTAAPRGHAQRHDRDANGGFLRSTPDPFYPTVLYLLTSTHIIEFNHFPCAFHKLHLD